MLIHAKPLNLPIPETVWDEAEDKLGFELWSTTVFWLFATLIAGFSEWVFGSIHIPLTLLWFVASLLGFMQVGMSFLEIGRTGWLYRARPIVFIFMLASLWHTVHQIL